MERLLKEGVHKTQTTQFRSFTKLNGIENGLVINKPEKENNTTLLLTICDSLNELYNKLGKLDYLMERRIIKYNLSQKEKGVKK